jgi:formylglycine-generating enzyme required for sulfatase activity
MLLVASGKFFMGTPGPSALANEQPVTPVTISRFYMSRFPITNAQYERFDSAHASKRAPWADDKHPVVYVSAKDAERFCEWLSHQERRRYRLPTEAEWEYAARGIEGRLYPWGEVLDSGCFANFADSRTSFAWRDPEIDDGWAQTSPVGSYPRGVSPFGIEDLAGNVFEWTLDGLEAYKGKELVNPRGPKISSQRVYRGGSWKSRATSLRATARAFNSPDYSSNDVGFRIVCECD